MKTGLLAFLSFVGTLLVAETIEEIGAREGGLVRLSGKGCLVFIDCRSDGSATDYKEAIEAVKISVRPDIRTVCGTPFSFGNANGQIAKSGGNVAVFVVDEELLPMTLTASEARWGLVNVYPLKADKPSASTLKHRISVLCARQAYRILGADSSKATSCCSYVVKDVKDIDKITSFDISWNASTAINESMPLLSIEPLNIGTYRDACELGIAHPPTNDLQRAIWDKVHAPPKTPLKIKFDPATQKGKVTK